MKINSPKLDFILPRLALSIVTLFILLGFIDLGLRLYVSKKLPIIFKLSESTAYKLNPNYQGNFSDVLVKTNSQGFRQNKDIQSNKEPSTRRILGLGDSVAFGFGLEEEKTYLRQLENLLNQSPKTRYEVINASVTGYNTFQERKLLQENIFKLKPNIIILSFVLNDIAGDFHIPNMVYRTLIPFKIGAYSVDDLNPFEKFFYFLFQHTYVYQFIHPKLSRFWGFEDPSTMRMIGHYDERTLFFYKNGYYPQKKYWGSFPQVEEELKMINELVNKNNAKLLIVIFPVQIQLEDKSLRKPQEILEGFCKENSLYCLDLLPILEKEKQKVFLDIGHPNAYSSEIITRAIWEYLVKNNII